MKWLEGKRVYILSAVIGCVGVLEAYNVPLPPWVLITVACLGVIVRAVPTAPAKRSHHAKAK